MLLLLFFSHCSCDLQREQQAANSRHDTEVFELKYQLQHLNSLVEKGRQVLQQKTRVKDENHQINKANEREKQ